MERLDVFDYSNILIGCYFTDDRECALENREHTLIYLCSGELEIEERGRKTVLHSGECAFMRRDNRVWLQKKVGKGNPYRSVVLKFSRPFLKEFYQTLNRCITASFRYLDTHGTNRCARLKRRRRKTAAYGLFMPSSATP